MTTNNAVQYRMATFADYTEIARLHTDSWRRTYRGIYSDQYLDHEAAQDRLDTWHKRLGTVNPNQHVTVALLDDRLIGFCCIQLDDDPVFGSLIDNLHVASTLHRSGVGKMLLSYSAMIIRNKASGKKVYLWVYENNVNARRAYEHLGATNFETIDKKNDDGSMARACRYTWDDVSKLIL